MLPTHRPVSSPSCLVWLWWFVLSEVPILDLAQLGENSREQYKRCRELLLTEKSPIYQGTSAGHTANIHYIHGNPTERYPER